MKDKLIGAFYVGLAVANLIIVLIFGYLLIIKDMIF